MSGSTRFALLMLALAAAPAELASQQPKRANAAPVRQQEAAALRDRIANLPAATVDTSVVMTAPEPESASPATPGASPPAQQPETSTVLRPQIDEARALPRELRFREVRFVPLGVEDEAKTRMAVEQQIQRQVASPVAVFEGAIRTLASNSAELTLKAVALGGSPMRYRPERSRFEGTLNVGVVELGGGRATRQLSEPIVFQVIGAVTAIPELAKAESTAPPYQTITVVSDSADAPVDVQVVSNVTPEGVRLTLPVQPALFVRVTPPQIQGWGLETADVLVQSRALGPTTNREVQLSTDGGIVAPTELTLSAAGMGTASIRSVSTGKAVITASGPAFTEASAQVEFLFPTRFLAAGILGGLAGGAVRLGVSGRAARRRVLAKLGLSVICGAIVFALYALGVNVIGFKLPGRAGELVVFAVAALGALGGVGLLKTPASQKP